MASYLAGRVQTVHGDITLLDVDAIVNAANAALCGGGGVDGAIHSAAGPGLLAECRTLGGAKTGEVKITAGYELRARHVIHAVGPVWQGGDHSEDFLLASCYLGSLDLLVRHGLTTIAFPSISTGAYRFPMERATRIALETVASTLEQASSIRSVIFCCFSYRDLQVYERLAAELFAAEPGQ